MKRLFLIVIVLAGSAALGSGVGQFLRPRPDSTPGEETPTHWTTAAPPMRLRTVHWEIGTTPPDKEVRKQIEIRNESNTPWTLRHLNATCACAVAKLTDKSIAPGESATLEITYQAPRRDGKVTGHVMVEFAEPSSPIVQVNLTATVGGQR